MLFQTLSNSLKTSSPLSSTNEINYDAPLSTSYDSNTTSNTNKINRTAFFTRPQWQ